MKAGINDRDWEILSACLDSRLTPAELRIVESRLLTEPDFKSAYISLLKTRAVLRSAPTIKRRRNYYLTPEMARQRTWNWLLPVVNLSSAATGLAALILLVLNLLPAGMKAAPYQENMAEQSMQAPAEMSTGIASDQTLPTLAYQADAQLPADAAKEGGAVSAGTQAIPEASEPNGLMASAPGMDNALEDKPAAETNAEEPLPAPPAAAPMLARGPEPTQEPAIHVTYAAPTEELKMAGAVQVTSPAPAATPGMLLQKAEVAATATGQPAAKIMEETTPGEHEKAENTKDMTNIDVKPGQIGAYLLLVSALLGLTGIYLRKRMR